MRARPWCTFRSLTVLLVVAAGIVVALAARGGQARPSTGAFATMDVQKATSGYKDFQTAAAELRAMQTTFRERLARRQSMLFLTGDEHARLDGLIEKGSQQSDADKAAIGELTNKASELQGTYAALSQRPYKDLTAEDRQRIAQGQALAQRARTDLEALSDQLAARASEFDRTNTERLDRQLRAAVQRVAERRGLSFVFNSQIVLYAGPDITPEVVSVLNAR